LWWLGSSIDRFASAQSRLSYFFFPEPTRPNAWIFPTVLQRLNINAEVSPYLLGGWRDGSQGKVQIGSSPSHLLISE
jgi:hypothetical protein